MSIVIVITIALFLMIAFPTILLFALKKHPKTLKTCTIILSIIYFTLLFIGTAFKVTVLNGNLVIKPNFTQNWFSMHFLTHNFSTTNILVNLALLFPIGFIVYIFAKNHRFLKTILFAFLISCIIEFYQFALPVARGTELTDLLFNTLSGLISVTYCAILEKFGLFKLDKSV